MGTPYSAIKESAKYAQAGQRLIDHLVGQLDIQIPEDAPIVSRPRVKVAVAVFSPILATDQLARVTATERAMAGGSNLLSGRLFRVADTTGKTFLPLKGYKPARMKWSKKLQTPVRQTARVTQLRYTKRIQETNSLPFGPLSDAETYAEAVKAMESNANGQFTNHDVKFTPEVV